MAILVLLDPQFNLKYVEIHLKQAFMNDPKPRIQKVKNIQSLFNEYFSQQNNDNTNFFQQTGQDHRQMVW
jgi:hypothetical protein